MSDGRGTRQTYRIPMRVLSRRGPVVAWLHRYPCVAVAVVAILGIVADSIWFDSFRSSVLFWAICSVGGALVSLATGRRASQPPGRQSYKSVLRLLATSVTIASAFALWHAWDEQQYRSATLRLPATGDQEPVVVRGRLSGIVTLRPNPLQRSTRSESPWQSQLEVALDSIREGDSFRSVSGNVLVFVDGDQTHLRPGNRLLVHGWLHGLSPPTNPGAADLRAFYRRRRLHGRIETKNADAIELMEDTSDVIGGWTAVFAKRGREALLKHTNERTGPLAIAMVIGQREFVDPPTRDALLATGTAHLLSVSGMHLAIIVFVAGWMVSAMGLPTTGRLAVIVGVSVLYALVTGNRPPVLRAAILVGFVLSATTLRRTSQPLNTLGAAALVLIVVNPMNVFAVGVHLSFLAVATLMLAGRSIESGSSKRDSELERELRLRALMDRSSSRIVVVAKSVGRFVMQMAWMSLCVTAMSFPLVWNQFNMVSLVSVVTNVLIWAGLMLALPAGVFTVMLDPMHPALGAIPGYVCHASLSAMWWVIEATSAIRWGHFWLPAPPSWMVWLFYAVMACSIPWRSMRARWFRFAWVLAWAVAALTMATRWSSIPEQTLEVTFIDVGHGTSVVLRTPDRRAWLYDCGSLGNDRGTGQDIDTALWSMGITRLEGVFLSHADADHYNALPTILERFSVDAIYTPPGMLQEDEPRLDAIRAAVALHQVPVYELSRGNRLGEATELLAMHPPRAGVAGSDNANSLVLRLDHGGTTLVLPGDLESPGTETLIAMERPIPAGVLMAPHHGSLSMNAEAVLAWARPREVVVSGGRRSARTEVRQMLSVVGSGVHGTAESGAIRIRINQTGEIKVRSWLTDPW